MRWLVTFVLLTSCVRQQAKDSISLRHAAEYGCTVGEVDLVEIDGRHTWAAMGCGQRAIYVCQQDTCLRNSEPEPIATTAERRADVVAELSDQAGSQMVECLRGADPTTFMLIVGTSGRIEDYTVSPAISQQQDTCVRSLMQNVMVDEGVSTRAEYVVDPR